MNTAHPAQKSISFDHIQWDFADSCKTKDLHSIHPYPAKFIPELPRALIQTLGLPAGTAVLDPFCGSGVTLVEAQNVAIPAIGIDLNPIACLISRVKTQPLEGTIITFANEAVRLADDFKVIEKHTQIPRLGHWFRPEISERISQLHQAIVQVADTRGVTDALELALSSIIVRVSNQESDTRYAAIEKGTEARDVDVLFERACRNLDRQLSIRPNMHIGVEVAENDITQVSAADIKMPIGLVITSPPYPAAYEYWLYHKYRMYWLGHDPIKVREQEIGARPHYFRKNPATPEDFQRQMYQLSSFIHSVMVRGGHFCIVVGSSKIHGEIVDNAALVSEAATEAGFGKLKQIERRVALARKSFNLNNSRAMTESILVFRKED